MAKTIREKIQSVRVIGGKLRGRTIHFPNLPGLRPTPDRVRETLFNWLMHDIHNAVVLDLFSGSGALGIEALSRGAKKAVFVEKEKAAAAQIESHLKHFGIPPSSYEIYPGEASGYLQKCAACGEKFDLIFLDPPFRQGFVAQVLPQCLSALSPLGKIYIEQESSLDKKNYLSEVADALTVLKEKMAGDVGYLLLGLS